MEIECEQNKTKRDNNNNTKTQNHKTTPLKPANSNRVEYPLVWPQCW